MDANRNVVPGARGDRQHRPEQRLRAATTTTDASGTVTGQIQTGGDKTDRVVTVTVTVNGITKRTAVAITGSRLNLNATPPSPSPGQSVTLTATLIDSAATRSRTRR